MLPLLCRREAGHSIGGSIWDIQTGTDNLVYQMDINAFSDNHLRAASYRPARKVSLLITNVYADREDHRHDQRRDYRQQEKAQYGRFSYLITDTLRDKRGSVLIPVESTGRCLEVLLLLERLWEENRLDSFKAIFLTK